MLRRQVHTQLHRLKGDAGNVWANEEGHAMFRGSEMSFSKCNLLASRRPGQVGTRENLLLWSRQERMHA